MASGSNAPIITNALVAWPPPPSSARFATSPPLSARKQRFSYVPSVHSPPQSPSTASFGNPGSAYPTHPSSPLSPLSGFATPPKPTLAAPVPVSARDREREARLASASGSDDDGRGPADRELGQRHDYPPPAKPLSPAQLARIAQSFGIVIPSLSNGDDLRTPISISPSPSPVPPVLSNGIKSPTSPHARSSNAPGPSSSGQVVAVLPPASLLSQAPDTDAATAHDRARRWRRGRLVPLQPTLGGMLVAIAREFGLPSTTGVSVYLGQQGGVGAGASRVSTASVDSEPGPLITPATWIALFGNAARSGSPASTPSGTPRKAHQAHNPRNASTATFGGGFPITPLAPLSEDTSYAPSASTTHTTASDEPELRDSKSSASSFAQPPTPASATLTASSFPQLPVFGTIEFDVDPTEARWLDDWLRSGGPSRRTGAAAAAGLDIPGAGIRELTLVERLKDDRPKFLRDMEREAARAQEQREENERLALAEADAARFARAQSEPLPQHTRSGSESRSPPVSPKGPRKMPPRHLPGGVLGSAAALRVRNPDVDADGNPIEESEEGMDTLSALASPIALPRRLNTELGRLDDDQRASAYVMEDQLNNLEKMMRDLSPRPFQVGPPRKTSKGALRPTTPVRAIGHLGQVSPDAFDRLSVIGSSSRLPYLQPDHVPAPGELSRRSVSQPNPAKGTASAPASALPTSPLSPPWRSTSLASAGEQANGANGFGHTREGSRGAMTAPVTPNPMSPGTTGPNGSTGATPTDGKHRLSRFGPAPPRPARPPTPDLTTPDLIPHVLPPEKVDVLKNTTAPLPSPTTRARPASMSLRGLKRQVSTSLAGNTKVRQRESRSYRENGDEGHKTTASIGSGSAGGSGSFSGSGSAPYPISSGPSSATSPRIAVSSVPGSGSGLSSSPREPPSAFSYTPPSSIYLASTSTSGGHPRTASGTTLTSDDEGHNAHNRRSRFFGFGKKRESRDLDGSHAHAHAHSHSHSSRNTIVHISSPIGTTHKSVSPAELAASMGIPTPPIPPRVPAPADDITSPIGLSPHMASTNASAISINSHVDSPRSPYASGTATPGSFGGATPGMFESGAGTPTGTGTPGVSPIIPGDGVNGAAEEGLSHGSSDEHSPRQVRRKPVPGMQGRESVQSVDGVGG